ncbi:MAG: GntP family permease, partial [Defluviitaleaceae bacterium]|nr:GntP family permease [Defluviitaleaceae bacterium]
MLSGIGLILFFLVMIVVMILAISKLKLHPFLAIMGVAIVLAFVAEGAGGQFLNLTETVTNANTGLQEVSATSRGTIIGSIGVGFSAIFSSIGIVIIFGALIGGILEATGGAFKIADMIVRLLGKASPTLAMLLMGWVISIPVFCDSGFVIANPVRKSIVKRTKASGIATGIALGAGLYTSHVLIPLTPGPLA